jgi:NAD(P)-dependent dehydrogenase (short-subunit alcohol dehydrogenase family)
VSTTVLITGAASGIGRASARLFARSGWRCVLVDRDPHGLRALAGEMPGAEHLSRVIDLTDPTQVAGLAEGMPRLDAIVNNAGMSDASSIPLAEQPREQLDRLLALNLAAPAAVVTACLRLLVPGARIVNLSSGAGLQAIPWRGAYSASKAGLIAQTLALARARSDLCVTVLCPGFVRTELVEGLIQAGRLVPESAVAKVPLGRMALPEEMAQAVFFLAGPGAAPLHGGVLAVNGGSSVFGGSKPFLPTTLETLAQDLPLRLEIFGEAANWQGVATPHPVVGPAYAARLDLSAMHAGPGGVLHAVHAAAVGFAARYRQQASLTLLLPTREPADWQLAGDAAAARMLVSTLACEWGSRALRINALEVAPGAAPGELHPLLRYVAGAGAQYLTGQTLACHVRNQGEPA